MYTIFTGCHGVIRRALCTTLLMGSLATVAVAGPSGTYTPIDPDFASTVPGTSLIGEGNVQIETNLARASDGEGLAMTRVWSTPTLLRLGMPNYEFRLQSGGYSRVRTYQSVEGGLSGMTVGIKGVLPSSFHRDVSMAILLQAGVPSGTAEFRQRGVRPDVQLIGAWQLRHSNSVSAVAGVRSDVDSNAERFATGVLGATFAHAWNPRVTSYAEVAAREIREAARGGKNLMWTMGAAWLAMPGTQLNASTAWGLKDNDTDFQWKLGLSRRFRPPTPGAMTKRDEVKPEAKPSATPETTPSATTEDGQ